MDNLDFDKSFYEQGKILCDIKKLLANDKSIACNPIITNKLNQTNFHEQYQHLKNKYSIFKANDLTQSKTDKKIDKGTRKTTIKSINKTSQQKKSKKPNRSLSDKKYKSKTGNINSRYPVVVIKKRTPRKNVIYV
jgi:hypothetical protein